MRYTRVRLAILFPLVLGFGISEGVHGGQIHDLSAQSIAAEEMELITLHVPDMSCRMCAKPIAHHLNEMGVEEIKIDLKTKLVTGRFDPARLTPDAIRTRIEKLGFRVASVQVG